MRILFIGYSNIVQKRVIPAILNTPSFDRIDAASQSSSSTIMLPDEYKGKIFSDYDTALNKSKADLVYISTVNSMHAHWAEEALARGFHVIVDKPSFTDVDYAKRLIELSQTKNLCLSEANIYAFHPQINLINNIFRKAESKPEKITALFSFPPMDKSNFRYYKKLGGGALWDVGPYAVSTSRLFFRDEPEEVFCRIGRRGGHDDVDISFSIMCVYKGGRAMVGHFGFDTEYRNYVNLLGHSMSVSVDRIFTTPPDMENELLVRQNNKASVIKAPKADSFQLFMQKIVDSIQNGNHKEFTDNLLTDSLVLHRLRVAANEEKNGN